MKTALSKTFFITSVTLFATLATVVSQNAQGNPVGEPPSKCYVAIRKVTAPQQDVAIEIETIMTQSIWSLTTTPDGKLGSLFVAAGVPMKPQIEVWAKNKFPELEPKDIPWSRVPLGQRVVIWHYLRSFTKDVILDRKVKGLMISETVPVQFSKATTLFGRTWGPGKVDFPIRHYIANYIEYTSNEYSDSIELHFRSTQEAGTFSVDVKRLLQMIGVTSDRQHMHIVSKIDYASLYKSPVTEAFKRADYFRRLNTATEMFAVMQRGSTLTQRYNEETQYFMSLAPGTLSEVFDFWLDLALKKTPRLKVDQAKMGWVGFHPSEKYDDHHVTGLQMRDVQHIEEYQHVLNAVQFAVAENNYGVSDDAFNTWLSAHTSSGNMVTRLLGTNTQTKRFELKGLIEKLWTNKEQELLLRNASPTALEALEKHRDTPAYSRILSSAETRLRVKWLLHDWSQDTLVWGNEELIEKIRSEQTRAIERLAALAATASERDYANYETSIIRGFLNRSGLYEIFLRSIHLGLSQEGRAPSSTCLTK